MDPLVLYAVGFGLLLLALGTGAAAYITRTESQNQPPIKADDLINALDEPIAVLDADGTVLTANVAFRSLFGAQPADRDIADVLAAHPDVLDTLDGDSRATVPVTAGGETKYFDVRHRPVGDGIKEDRKRLVLLQDVTDRRDHQRKLERQNDQLDEVASIISHDLRNPLDVALGRTNLVREELDGGELDEHLQRVQDAHGRMEQIITDVLTLARDGGNIDTTETVTLEQVADTAWAHVDTGTATLSVETARTVEADCDRLARVFENLFRNAVEHAPATDQNSEHLTVCVGDLADGTGFFVADDGQGLAPDEHERVFETGYSGNGSSTGLGLAIVAHIARAHGWEVYATDSEDGGARFEFHGLDAATDEHAPRAG
jgi:signal transduction histidine kinase